MSRLGHFRGAGDAHDEVDGAAGGLAEFFRDDGFEVVGLDDAVAGEALGHCLHQLRDLRLRVAAGAADFAAVNRDGHDAHRQHDDGNERQPGLLEKQEGQHANQ